MLASFALKMHCNNDDVSVVSSLIGWNDFVLVLDEQMVRLL